MGSSLGEIAGKGHADSESRAEVHKGAHISVDAQMRKHPPACSSKQGGGNLAQSYEATKEGGARNFDKLPVMGGGRP